MTVIQFLYNDTQIHRQHKQQLTNDKKVQSQDWNTLGIEAYKMVYAWWNKEVTRTIIEVTIMSWDY